VNSSIRRLAILIALLTLPMLVPAVAQQNVTTVASFVRVQEDGSQQTLDIYFTLLDSAGNPISDRVPDSASLLFDDGMRVDNVELTQPRDPIFIALVLDSSGSMRQAVDQMKQAAIDAVNSAPPEAVFAVYQFNEQITLLQGLTLDRGLVINAINRLQVSNLGTCLYDATMESLNLIDLVDRSNRRAVILFTDGRDEMVAGGELDPCSQSRLEDVTTRGIEDHIPLYTIGLQGNAEIAATELRNMAALTGGLARIGELNTLPRLFQEVMQALTSQWRARGGVCRPNGRNTGTLNVTFERQRLTPLGFSVDVAGGCELPTPTRVPSNTPTPTPTNTPVPLRLSVTAIDYDLGTESAFFILERSGDIPVSRFEVLVTNAQTGNLLAQQQVEVDAANRRQQVTIDTTDLPAVAAQVVVAALDESGATITRSAPVQFTITRPTPTPTTPPTLTPTLAPVTLDLEPVRYDPATDSIMLNFVVEQRERIIDFRVDLIDTETNFVVRQYTPPLEQLGLIIPLSVAGLLTPGREYTVRVVAQTDSGERIREESVFTYTATPTPTITLTPSSTLTRTPTFTLTPSATATLPPVIVEISNLRYEGARNALVLTMNLQEIGRVTDFRIDLIDAETGFTEVSFAPELGVEIILQLSNLQPDHRYRVRVTASVLSEFPVRSEAEFLYAPPRTATLTPSATATMTLTPTPTLVPGVTIDSIDIETDPINSTLIISISSVNATLVDGYRIRLVNAQTNIEELSLRVNAPADNRLQFPIGDLPAGEYIIEIELLDANGQLISETSGSLIYTPPPPPTPTPAPSILDLAEQVSSEMARTARQDPIIFAIVVILIIAILLVLVIVAGRIGSRRRARGRGYDVVNPDTTGFIGVTPNINVNPSSGSSDSTATMDTTKIDYADTTKIEAIPFAGEGNLPPGISVILTIRQSNNDQTMKGKPIHITKSPFLIGRSEGDLVLSGDDYLSRLHARIIYQDGGFYIEDLGSSGGTFVNNVRVEKEKKMPITSGAIIRLATRTELDFSAPVSSN